MKIANGEAENEVKTAKHILEKGKKDNQDPYLALLKWRNTPSSGMTTSPAQRMMNRRTRTSLPVHSHLLDSEITNEKEVLIKLKRQQEVQYNKGPNLLEILKILDLVRMKPIQGNQWKIA